MAMSSLYSRFNREDLYMGLLMFTVTSVKGHREGVKETKAVADEEWRGGDKLVSVFLLKHSFLRFVHFLYVCINVSVRMYVLVC